MAMPSPKTDRLREMREAKFEKAQAKANRRALLTKRQAKWRSANPDANRQRAKEGMRKLRAKA